MQSFGDDPDDIRLSAVMSKKARGRNNSLLRPWTKRIFVLRSESRMLVYYSIPLTSYDWKKNGPPRELKRGELSLLCCSVEAVTQHPSTTEFPFRIFSPHGELLIAATSAEQRDEWVAAINELSVPTLSALDSKCHSSPPRPRSRSFSSPKSLRRTNSAPDPAPSFASDDSWYSGCTSLEDSLGSSTDLNSTLSSHSNSLSSEDDPSVRDILHCYSMDELLKRRLEKSPIQRVRASTIGICTFPHRRKSFDLTEPPIDEAADEEGSLYISPASSCSEGEEEEAITICTNSSPAEHVEELLSPLFPEHPGTRHIPNKTRNRHYHRAHRHHKSGAKTGITSSDVVPMEVESPYLKFNNAPPDQKSWEAIFQAQLQDDDI